MTKLVSLISGGIDSPVASYLMSKAGADITLLHMDNGKFGDPKDLEKVLLIAKRLEEETGKEFPVYVGNHEVNQQKIMDCGNLSYQCVLCKRIMHHTAKGLAQQIGASGIVMGDSLGQVASQTLMNIRAEQQDLSFPIVRPLIGLDKEEIIAIAKKIGTFDLSIIKTSGCAAVPIRPITEAKPDMVLSLQEKMGFEDVIRNSVTSLERVHR